MQHTAVRMARLFGCKVGRDCKAEHTDFSADHRLRVEQTFASTNAIFRRLCVFNLCAVADVLLVP